ncbi:MAG: sialate O-acetylesterase [Treponema sp.]|nr:sialate O-acetylesterase [Treponema sp.]
MKKLPFTIAGLFAALTISLLLVFSCSSVPVTNGGEHPEGTVTHIYIAFGQSNMQGPGKIEAQDKADISDRFQILNVVPAVYNGKYRGVGQWCKAVPPLIIPDANIINWKGLPTGLSPVDYFGRTLTENTPENIIIGVIAVASGDLGLAAFAKDNATVMKYYNTTASSTAKQGMDNFGRKMYTRIIDMAKIAQKNGEIKGIIVHQGESGVDNKSGVGWGDLLKLIYDDMLSDLGLEPNSIPILAGQTFGGGSGNTNGDLNADKIKQFIPKAEVISSVGCDGRLEPDGVSIDNIHFGTTGLRELGKRYGAKMLELNY